MFMQKQQTNYTVFYNTDYNMVNFLQHINNKHHIDLYSTFLILVLVEN